MKKTWILFASLTLAISMLSACNSSNESNGNEDESTTQVETDKTNGEETAEEVVEDTEESVEETEETEEVAEEQQPASEERGPEKTLTYSVNEEVKEDTAKLTDSDEQNYSLYKLDGYTLTGEEPNKDSLYLDENPAVFMRVETISKDDASYQIIADNMVETIAAVSVGKEPVEIAKDKLPQGEGVLNPIGYETTFELGTVSGYVFEQGNLIVRLSIFDQQSVNLTDAFLKMGETVAAKK
jgi:hypothetical protein